MSGPRRAILAPGTKESVAVPSEAISAREQDHGSDVARQNILGLIAVGIPFEEAFPLFSRALSLAEAIVLTGEKAPNGTARVKLLYDYQTGVADKRAFAKVCLEHGLNPVGIALAAMDFDPRKASEGGFEAAECNSRARALELIESFGVDTWLGERITSRGWMRLRPAHPMPPITAGLVVPGFLEFDPRFRHEVEKILEMPWLEEVGVKLRLSNGCALSFPNLTRIGGRLQTDDTLDVSFPALKEVGEAVQAQDSKRLSFPVLESIGEGLFDEKADKLFIPKLRLVDGKPYDATVKK